MQFTEAEILAQVTAFMLPFLRVSSMLVSIPVFGVHVVPVKLRIVLSILITILIMPLIPAIKPVAEIFSLQGFLVVVQQVVLGITSGFILQLVFAAVIFAGQSIAYGMGLGFASMIDPQNGQQVPVIAQLYSVTTTLTFLMLDGHLILIKMLADSFVSLPISSDGFDKHDLWSIVVWSGHIFSDGLLLAMPVVMSLLLVNVTFGVASRAAPQLQIFSVGFPITLMLGMFLMWLTLPNLLDEFSELLNQAFQLIKDIMRL